MWFEKEKFVNFVRQLSESPEISAAKTRLFKRRDVRPLHKVTEKDKSCPRCYKKLSKFNYSYDSNVILDKCPDCGGIWADKGEVEQVAAYLKKDPNVTAVAERLIELTTLANPDIEPDKVRAGYYLSLLRIVVPLSDDVPRQRFPLVTVCIIALCTILFAARLYLQPERFWEKLGLFPEGSDSIDLFSSMFLNVGLLSFVLNMLFLWLFGDNVEDRFSRLGYLCFYLCCGLFASFVFRMFNDDLSITAIGISGAVSGIMGAYFIFYPVANIKLFVFFSTVEVPAAVFLGLWFLFQLLSPFIFRDGSVLNAAWPAHASGFVFGMAVAFFKKSAVQAKE
jgi:membrane associated rhomboid family serine protease